MGIRIYTKGADEVYASRILQTEDNMKEHRATMSHLNSFAERGYRTLYFGYRNITMKELNTWRKNFFDEAKNKMDRREQAKAEAYNKLEKDFLVLGATSIED